ARRRAGAPHRRTPGGAAEGHPARRSVAHLRQLPQDSRRWWGLGSHRGVRREACASRVHPLDLPGVHVAALSRHGHAACRGDQARQQELTCCAVYMWSRSCFPGGDAVSRPEPRRAFDMAKYGRKASEKVERAMHERKRGTLRSGRSGKKVTSRKQAIAIGLSEARKAGGKVPKKKGGSKKRGGSKKKK